MKAKRGPYHKQKVPLIEPIKRSNGTEYYRVRISVNGKRVQHTFESKAEAEQWISKLVETRVPKVIANKWGTQVQLFKIYEQWLPIKRMEVRGSSLRNFKVAWRSYLKPFHGRTLASLSKLELSAFFKTLGAKYSRQPYGSTFQLLKQLNEFAIEELDVEGLSFNLQKVAASFRPSTSRSTEFLTKDEFVAVNKILVRYSLPLDKAMPGGLRRLTKSKEELILPNWLGLFLHLAIATGMRRAELLGLRWRNVDFKKSKIYVRDTIVFDENSNECFAENQTKTSQSRRDLEISPLALKALEGLRIRADLIEKRTGRRSEFVFCTPMIDSKRDWIGYQGVGRALKKLMVYAGYDGISPHKLRATFATLFLERATGKFHTVIKLLQDALGHENPDMSLYYAKIRSNESAAEMKAAFGTDLLEE